MKRCAGGGVLWDELNVKEAESVWQDLAKFGKSVLLLGQFSVPEMAKYWTNNLVTLNCEDKSVLTECAREGAIKIIKPRQDIFCYQPT